MNQDQSKTDGAAPVSSTPLFCDCFEFEAAQEMGTDNEGFCSIIFQYGSKYYLVSDFPAISYCPWCGKRVPQNAAGERPQ